MGAGGARGAIRLEVSGRVRQAGRRRILCRLCAPIQAVRISEATPGHVLEWTKGNLCEAQFDWLPGGRAGTLAARRKFHEGGAWAARVAELSRPARIVPTSLLQCSAILVLFTFERHAASGCLSRFHHSGAVGLQADTVR